MPDPARHTGVVKRFISGRGFGFAGVDGMPNTDVFVHVNDVRKHGQKVLELRTGTRLEFDLTTDEKGTRAQHAIVLDQ